MEGANKDTQKKTTEGWQEGVEYKANMGTATTKENLEKEEGYYDNDGFYILPDGSFYDPNGYKFNDNGYDEFGGYYDQDENGAYSIYVPGPDYAEEYYRKYQEVYGEEDEDEYNMEDYFSESDHDENDDDGEEGQEQVSSDAAKEESKELTDEQKKQLEEKAYKDFEEQQKKEEDEKKIEAEANRLITAAYHINPALEWLKEQPEEEGKQFTVRIQNVPLKAKPIHIEKLVRSQLKKSGKAQPEDFEKCTKIVFDKDSQGYNLGNVWFQSSHRDSLVELIKLHNKVWIYHKLKTFLMGIAYDETTNDFEGNEYQDEDDDKITKNWRNPEVQKEVYKKHYKKVQPQRSVDPSVKPAADNKTIIDEEYGVETINDKGTAASVVTTQKKKEKTSQQLADDYGKETE